LNIHDNLAIKIFTLKKNKKNNLRKVNYLGSAKRALEIESQALQKLKKSIGKEFLSVINVLSKIKGRIIISGVGKSGHVGKKIAATLSSTGTPSMFIHPTEASHGDLGMITKSDAIILLSNSGESPELDDMITYAKRYNLPLVGITSKRKSTLVNSTEKILLLPEFREACPLKLAPTTSTTMMMALGDALAISLLEKRSFSSENFKKFHPGGQLGSKMQTVKDLMHKGREMPLIESNKKMGSMLILMTEKRLGCVGIINQKKSLIGVVTDGDLRRNMNKNLLEKKISDIMNKKPKVISQEKLAVEALNLMNKHKITQLFVTNRSIPMGVIHIHDLYRVGIK